MPQFELLLQPDLADRVSGFFEARSEAAEPSEERIREGLRFLSNVDFVPEAGRGLNPNADLAQVVRVIATVAWSDLASAFPLWCHRMVLEYLWAAPSNSAVGRLFERVQGIDLLGSTAMAAAFAHYVSGAPLPVTARRVGDEVVLSGRVNWASNLFPPRFAIVTAACDAETGHALIVALPGDTLGIDVQPYPHIMALQATGSSSVAVDDVAVPRDCILDEDFRALIQRVRPTFLMLQSAFCWGLASRALAEARGSIRGINEVLCPDLERLEATSDHLGRLLHNGASNRGQNSSMRNLVQLRLDCAQLATAAVSLEAKIMGGRGYVNTTGTARRVREAAFLPIQAPTEGQLRWELSRCA